MARRKVDKDKAIKQKVEQGLSYGEIGKLQGVTKQAIYNAIKNLIPSEEEIRDIQLYKNVEADIFAGLRSRIIAQIDEATLKRMLEKHAGAAVMLLNSAFNNERLLRGESTSNVAEFHKAIQVLKRIDDEPDSDTPGQDDQQSPGDVIDVDPEQ